MKESRHQRRPRRSRSAEPQGLKRRPDALQEQAARPALQPGLSPGKSARVMGSLRLSTGILSVFWTAYATATTWSLYLNGTLRGTPWQANTGTTGIGRIQLGDTAAKTWAINFDDVVLDQTPG